jgi:hypothetical protein
MTSPPPLGSLSALMLAQTIAILVLAADLVT